MKINDFYYEKIFDRKLRNPLGKQKENILLNHYLKVM